MLSRRALLQQLSAAAVAAHWPALATARRLIPWKNWSGAQVCIPAMRAAPGNEDEVAELVKTSRGEIRPVGSAHSFSALVPTEDTLVSLSRLSGLIGHDPDALTAEFWAGTPMAQMGDALKAVGQALNNMADIDYQTLAGALATSTHGTGVEFPSYSADVTGMRLVDGQGEIHDLSREREPALFDAARVSLGALGIATRVQMQNRSAFRLKEDMWLQRTEELLEDIDRLTRENRHWEMQVITNSDYAASIALNETDAPATGSGDDPDEGGNAYVKAIEMVDQYAGDLPGLQRFILNTVAKTASFEPRVADSYKIYANVRNVRFNEMEYAVPAEAGPACLRAILERIRERELPTWFPIEYRYVKGDDIPLSMYYGRDSCAISVHQYYRMDYHNFFAEIEPIFWRFEGRPHWGKLHNLGARQLAPLYPRWQDFQEAREALDPGARFLNAHLRKVLGAPA